MQTTTPTRLFSVLLTILVFILTACGGGSGSTATSGGTSGNTTTRYSIALVVGQTADNFYTSMQCGAQEEAKRLGNVDLTVQGPQTWDASLQIPIVNALTTKRVQAMAVVVNDSKALYAPLKTASDSGIKILGVDTKLDNTDFEVTNISSDNHALGVEAAKTLAKLMGDKGTALTSPLQPGVSTVGDRVQGFLDEMKTNHPDIKIVYLGNSSSSDSAVAAFNAAFVAHPDVNGIFAVANLVSEAATTALKGLPASRQKNISIIGFDAGPTAVNALKAGQIQGLVAQKPAEMGALAVDNALQALQGKTVAHSIPTGGVSLTQSNIDDPNYAKYIYKSSC